MAGMARHHQSYHDRWAGLSDRSRVDERAIAFRGPFNGLAREAEAFI